MAEDYAEPSIRMPEKLNRRVRVAAAKEEISRAELIRRLLYDSIDDIENRGLSAVVDCDTDGERESVEA